MTRQTRYILCLDGGGIRGVIPTLVLQELCHALNRYGWHRPIHQTFDLIAGTSTGGIVAGGLAAPHHLNNSDRAAATPEKLTRLYIHDGPGLFSRSIWQRLKSADGLLSPRYPSMNMARILKTNLGAQTKISQAQTHLVLTAYDLEARAARFLTNCGYDSKRSDDFFIWQAALATASAPTFFPPATIQNLNGDRAETLVDGGVFANDPVLAALVEGFKMGWHLEDMVVLSVGTGSQTHPIPASQAVGWGPLSWISPTNGSPLISIFMQGQASTASYQAQHLLSEINRHDEPKTDRYLRIDAPLQGPSDKLDDTSPKNLRELIKFGSQLSVQFSEQIDIFAKMRARGHISGIKGRRDALQSGAIND
ncbi:MAG: patatin-like phospholipase family protein [Hyphomicrobiales bacterium]